MFQELAVERAVIEELTRAQSNGHPQGLYYAELARAIGEPVHRVKQVVQKSPRLQAKTAPEHRGRRLVTLIVLGQPTSMADAIAQVRPRKPAQQVVYRLRYRWVARDEDGEPITNAAGEPEWGSDVVRYYWTRPGLEAKLRRLLAHGAQIVALEVARVSAFRGVRA